jgi:hypothetical protein
LDNKKAFIIALQSSKYIMPDKFVIINLEFLVNSIKANTKMFWVELQVADLADEHDPKVITERKHECHIHCINKL